MEQLKNFTLLFALFTMAIGCRQEAPEIAVEAYTSEELRVLSADLNLPQTPFFYSFQASTPEANLSHKGTLGRVLFYDKNLSADATVSCASCHQQSLAFSDDRAFSEGANGNVTARNSIALGSVTSFGSHYLTDKNNPTPGLFWDERATTIKEQLEQTIRNPNEMGMDLAQIVNLVENTDYYQILHQKAFPNEVVTSDHVLEAIEVFVNSIGSVNSEFDTERFGDLNFITGDSVTDASEDNLGLRTFVVHCAGCHGNTLDISVENLNKTPLFTANNGLKLNQSDQGVFEYSGKQADIGKFKIPGLRNIELTSPYMHDGRFDSLEEVVDFYNSKIEFHPNLHESLRDGNRAKRLNLSDDEKTALVDFLKSLTDIELTEKEKWSSPF